MQAEVCISSSHHKNDDKRMQMLEYEAKDKLPEELSGSDSTWGGKGIVDVLGQDLVTGLNGLIMTNVRHSHGINNKLHCCSR